jgi:hypothetical protein
MNRGRSVGIVTGYGLDGRGSSLGGGKIFFSYPRRPTGSEVNLVFYTVGTGTLCPGVKRPVCKGDDHSSSAEVKNGEAILPPHTSSWRGAQLIKHGDNFTFYLYSMGNFH